MGALEIPIGTYHRSISGKEGSIVLNQPKRDKFFDPAKEFIPQKLDKINLIKARKSPLFIGFTKITKSKESILIL